MAATVPREQYFSARLFTLARCRIDSVQHVAQRRTAGGKRTRAPYQPPDIVLASPVKLCTGAKTR